MITCILLICPYIAEARKLIKATMAGVALSLPPNVEEFQYFVELALIYKQWSFEEENMV
jgi:hypothetical protein